MKRTGIKRGKPLERRTEMPRGKGPKRKAELKHSGKPLRDYAKSTMQRYARIRYRSAKTEKVYREGRRPLVVRLLEERPWCEIRWDDGCTRRATEVDEVLNRSQGGSITDEDNVQVGCSHCHRMKTGNPAEARRRGLAMGRHKGPEPPEGVA